MPQMASLSFWLGRSTKINSSNLPLRNISAFNLAPCQPFRRSGQLHQIKIRRIAAIFPDLNAPDGLPLILVGQIHEDQFVKPALAQHFCFQSRSLSTLPSLWPIAPNQNPKDCGHISGFECPRWPPSHSGWADPRRSIRQTCPCATFLLSISLPVNPSVALANCTKSKSEGLRPYFRI